MIKQILIFMLAIVLINNVIALDKSLGLSPTQITDLEAKGIKNIEVIEYPCDAEHKCFAVDGDIEDKLVNIPLRVRDNCITKLVDVKKNRRDCTGVYNYRDITQKEIDYIKEKALNKKLSDKVPESKTEYYPIPDGTNVKSQPIEIGKSAGSIKDKIIQIIKDIGDKVGL